MEKSENGDREREKEMMKKIERQIYRDKERLGDMEREFMRYIIFIPFETEYKIEK